MPENRDHWKIKKQISDYHLKYGWKSDTEVKIKMFHDIESNDVKSIITVDVLAFKDGSLYICEVGSVSSLQREVNLRFFSEQFEHLSLGRKHFRRDYEDKWDKVSKIRFKVPNQKRRAEERKLIERLKYHN